MASSRPAFKVAAGRSVRHKDVKSKVRIVFDAGDPIPDEISDEQVQDWLANGFVELVNEPQAKSGKYLGPTTAEMRRDAQEELRLRDPRQVHRRQQQLRREAPPVVVHPGVWNRDPATLRGVPLDKLQVAVAEIAEKYKLQVDMPKTAAEAAALLSSEFVPGTQPQ
jgi:hypothetical protein